MRRTTICYTVPPENQGSKAGPFLRSKGFSERLITRIKKEQGILADGTPVFTNYQLNAGQTLEVRLPPEEDSPNILPVPLPFSVVYEDPDILVVHKDAGVPIHPSQGHYDNTLANGAAWYFKEKGEPFTYRVINRLDRDTTGLLILAKHLLAASLLSEQMSLRQIHREYRAIVLGHTPDHGVIDRPISRVPGSTIERQIDPENGERAVTHYETLAYCPDQDISLIRLTLETGRTHQIRVHMRSIGHPLPGDFLYCPDYRLIGRQPLHSYRLQFRQPVTGEAMDLYAPLPEDMARLISHS